MSTTTIVVVLIYIIGVFYIGVRTGKGGSESEEAYFTGNKSFGAWATAISAGATNSSGWIYIGAVGFAYAVGVYSMWMLVGFSIGGFIDYIVIAPNLRNKAKKLGALNHSDFFEKTLQKEWGVSKDSHIVRIISAILLVVFFTAYMAAQLTAAGKTVNALINIDYNVGLIFAAIFVIGFCYFGGYKSVIYTDLTQGLIMLAVFIVTPLVLIFGTLGGWSSFWQQVIAIDPMMVSTTLGSTGTAAMSVILGWIMYGVGIIGQPHCQQRYITAKDDDTMRNAVYILTAWSVIVMTGSNLLGICARVLLPNLADAEYAFPLLVSEIFPGVILGIVIAAIFSAIASTYSSQLMVAVQAISSDLLHSFSKKDYTQKEIVKVSQITMIVLGIVSTMLALLNLDTVFALVNYAWSATASSFGPVLLLMLIKPKLINKEGAVTGLIVGAIVPTVWYVLGLSNIIHEIAPGLAATFILIPLVTKLTLSKYKIERVEKVEENI